MCRQARRIRETRLKLDKDQAAGSDLGGIVYDKKLKRGKDGLFTRYVGQNARGTPEKFRLGYEQEAAEERIRLIAALWTEIEGRTPSGHRPSWDLSRRPSKN
jgi:hypothetical protein